MFKFGDNVMGYTYDANGVEELVTGTYISTTVKPNQEWQDVSIQTEDGRFVRLIEHSVCWVQK